MNEEAYETLKKKYEVFLVSYREVKEKFDVVSAIKQEFDQLLRDEAPTQSIKNKHTPPWIK